MSIKVLIITYYWPPAGGPGVQRWLKFVKYLPGFDIEPVVLTVDPNFATYPQIDSGLNDEISKSININKTRTFEFFSFYKKITGNEEIPFSGFANEKGISPMQKISRFIRGNFFIPDPRKGWNKYAYKRARKLTEEHKINIIISTGPPHSTHLIGKKLKLKKGIKWIADMRDPWVDIYYYDKFYPTMLSKKIDAKFERNTFNFADKIIVVSDSMRLNYAGKYPKFKDKISVIPNGYDPEDIKNVKIHENDKFTITYTGTMSEIYPMEIFLNSLEEIKSGNIKIVLIGNIHEKFIKLIKEKNLEHLFVFKGRTNHNEALNYMFSSDLLLLLIPNTRNNKEVVTGKIYEYLASGKPIICIGPTDGDAAKIIKETKAGDALDYFDRQGIIESLNKYISWNKQIKKSEQNKIKKYSRKELTRILYEEIKNLDEINIGD